MYIIYIELYSILFYISIALKAFKREEKATWSHFLFCNFVFCLFQLPITNIYGSWKRPRGIGHPHPLGQTRKGAQLPPHRSPAKNLSREKRRPKKIRQQKNYPSKNIKQNWNKVLTAMKIYSIIEMQSEKIVHEYFYWRSSYIEVPERYMGEKKAGRCDWHSKESYQSDSSSALHISR